ncbi:MAG TPA: phosphotransferase, partial [Streptosporangiaceae bacterium]
DNAILDPGPPPLVTLFDWELSGFGDPAWDVGSALADTVSIPVRLEGPSRCPAEPVEWVDPTVRAVLCAYGSAGQKATEGFAERVGLSWVARLVHLTLETAAAVKDPYHDLVVGLMTMARQLAGHVDEVVPLVRSALGPPP